MTAPRPGGAAAGEEAAATVKIANKFELAGTAREV